MHINRREEAELAAEEQEGGDDPELERVNRDFRLDKYDDDDDYEDVEDMPVEEEDAEMVEVCQSARLQFHPSS